MKRGSVPGVEKPVSRLMLGTMIVNTKERERSYALLDAAVAAGLNALDAAHVYAGGDSERCIGDWMKERGNREKVVILTKGCHPNADRKRVTPFDIQTDLHDSLARLKTPYVDVYVLHRDDPSVPVGPIVETFDRLRKEGKLRAYGGSNWRHERIQEANDYAAKHGLVPFTASSPNYGLAEQVDDPWGPGCVTLSGPKEAAAREWYAKTNTPIFAYSSLGRGFFSGRISRASFEQDKEKLDGACRKAYCHEVNFKRLDRAQALAGEKGLAVPQVAMSWVLSQPLNVFAIVGAASAEEIRANVEASELSLTPAELAWLDLRADSR